MGRVIKCAAGNSGKRGRKGRRKEFYVLGTTCNANLYEL
jgi:hypothetical protein